MDAIIDEASRAVFLVVAAPHHIEHIAQRRLTDFTANAIPVDLQNFLHGSQSLAAQNLAKLVLGERDALAERLLRFFLKLRRNGLQ